MQIKKLLHIFLFLIITLTQKVNFQKTVLSHRY